MRARRRLWVPPNPLNYIQHHGPQVKLRTSTVSMMNFPVFGPVSQFRCLDSKIIQNIIHHDGHGVMLLCRSDYVISKTLVAFLAIAGTPRVGCVLYAYRLLHRFGWGSSITAVYYKTEHDLIKKVSHRGWQIW